MATRKDRKPTAERPPFKRRRSKLVDEFPFPSEQERLPVHVPGTYQVAMGRGEEILTLLQDVPPKTQVIMIPFPNEPSFRIYGPIFWHLAHQLPEIVARVQRRKLEELVDALSEWFLHCQTPYPKRRLPRRKLEGSC